MAPTSFAVGPILGTMLCCCAGIELGTLDAFFFFSKSQVMNQVDPFCQVLG